MIARETFYLLVAKAYRLALFLHPEPATARQLVERAVTLLPATYRPRKPKRATKRHSRRAVFDEAQWLQHLILYFSERLERDEERHQTPSQGVLIKRYLEHLVQICLPNTMLHVAVGMTRLFFHYSTADTNLILEHLDENRIVEEASINRIKGNLQRQLKQRFGDLLQETMGPNREKLFVSMEDSEPWLDLVASSLEHFTPWQTECGRDETDLQKSHRLIHLPCFESSSRELGLEEPLTQLRLPRGVRMDHDDDRDPLGEEMAPREQADLYRHYSWVVQMRQRVLPSALTLRVGGRAPIQWDLRSARSCSLDLEESDRVLEVWTENEEVPLAVFHLGQEPDSPPFDLGRSGRLDLAVSETARGREARLTFWPTLRQRWALFSASPIRVALWGATAVTICLVLGFVSGRNLYFDDEPEPLWRSQRVPSRSKDLRLDEYDRAAARALFERGEYLFGSQPERAGEALETLEIAYSLSGSDPRLTRDILERIIFIATGLGEDEKAAFYREQLSELQRPPP